jgi:hypothetical protein
VGWGAILSKTGWAVTRQAGRMTTVTCYLHGGYPHSEALVRDRILYAVRVFGGPERLQIMPDCGLRTRFWETAYRKLATMTAGVRLARAALGP